MDENLRRLLNLLTEATHEVAALTGPKGTYDPEDLEDVEDKINEAIGMLLG